MVIGTLFLFHLCVLNTIDRTFFFVICIINDVVLAFRLWGLPTLSYPTLKMAIKMALYRYRSTLYRQILARQCLCGLWHHHFLRRVVLVTRGSGASSLQRDWWKIGAEGQCDVWAFIVATQALCSGNNTWLLGEFQSLVGSFLDGLSR